jgi:hypothetical protein
MRTACSRLFSAARNPNQAARLGKEAHRLRPGYAECPGHIAQRHAMNGVQDEYLARAWRE